MKTFPFYTPYQFAGNMPIAAIDLDGLEIYFAADGRYIGKWGTSTEVRVVGNNRVKQFQQSLHQAANPRNQNDLDVMIFYWSGAAGSRTPTEQDMRNIAIEHVIPPSTSEHYSTSGDCFTAATTTLANNGYEEGTYWAPDNQYQYQMDKEITSPDADVVEARQVKSRLAGFEKINSELEAGRPVLVGLNYQSGSKNPNTDGTTDHFLVLTGRGFDADGKLFYTGFESVDGGSTERGTSSELNRFYPQASGKLSGSTVYTSGTITQVRPAHKTESE